LKLDEVLLVKGSYHLEEEKGGRSARWWGSAVRGSLGRAWLQFLCLRPGQACEDCPLRESCRYPAIWNPTKGRPEEPGPAYRPAPFRLTLSLQGNAGLSVTLWVYGPESRFASQWASVLDLAMLRFLEGAGRVSPKGAVRILPSPASRPLPSHRSGDLLSLKLRSPLRLVADGRPLRHPPTFLSLFEAIHRKASICAKSWGWPPPVPLSEQERRLAASMRDGGSRVGWVELERFSSRQGRSMSLGGLEGILRFEGPWPILWPRLQPAEFLGLGRLTTMGFGDVRWKAGTARARPAPP